MRRKTEEQARGNKNSGGIDIRAKSTPEKKYTEKSKIKPLPRPEKKTQKIKCVTKVGLEPTRISPLGNVLSRFWDMTLT